MPAFLRMILRPRHHVRNPRRNILIAARAHVKLHGGRGPHAAHQVRRTERPAGALLHLRAKEPRPIARQRPGRFFMFFSVVAARHLKQPELVRLNAAQRLIIQSDAANPPVLGEGAGLRLDFLGGKYALHGAK